MGQTPAAYPFYKANIHEKRAAAYVARALPLVCLLLVVVLLVLGVLRNTILLLTVTAVLNVAMWLWIVGTAIAGIFGSFAVQDLLEELEANPKSASNFGSQESQDAVRHVIVLPNYKEDEKMLDETLQNLKEAKGSEHFLVVLAMEARETEAREKAVKLEDKHADSFARITSTFHPSNLEEIHEDGSSNAEVPGKASNLKYAVAEVCKAVGVDSGFSSDSSVLTVADADVFFHPMYFEYIGNEFAQLREAGGGQHKWTLWQAPQLPWRNFYDCPVVSRTWGYISSLWEFGGVSELRMGGHHMVFSAYSLSLRLAEDAQCWDGDVIAEDHHTYLKSFFYGAYKSLKVPENPLFSPVRVQAVMLPAKSTSVNSSDGYWATWSERWHQATRHTQGVAEVSYALLASWDLLCTVPVTAFSLSFLLKLVKVVMKPAMMHLVSTMQAIALAILTLYWLASGNQVPMCPDSLVVTHIGMRGDTLLCGLAGAWVLTWPIVVPFALLMAANYLMIRICFLQPAEKDGKRSLWHASDGGVKPLWGSTRFATIGMIILDCAIFLGPIMAVYGIVAELLAYWNVLVRGNFFTYITASKALSNNTEYGSMGSAQAPAAKGSQINDTDKPEVS